MQNDGLMRPMLPLIIIAFLGGRGIKFNDPEIEHLLQVTSPDCSSPREKGMQGWQRVTLPCLATAL
jgi:hypothetical protein